MQSCNPNEVTTELVDPEDSYSLGINSGEVDCFAENAKHWLCDWTFLRGMSIVRSDGVQLATMAPIITSVAEGGSGCKLDFRGLVHDGNLSAFCTHRRRLFPMDDSTLASDHQNHAKFLQARAALGELWTAMNGTDPKKIIQPAKDLCLPTEHLLARALLDTYAASDRTDLHVEHSSIGSLVLGKGRAWGETDSRRLIPVSEQGSYGIREPDDLWYYGRAARKSTCQLGGTMGSVSVDWNPMIKLSLTDTSTKCEWSAAAAGNPSRVVSAAVERCLSEDFSGKWKSEIDDEIAGFGAEQSIGKQMELKRRHVVLSLQDKVTAALKDRAFVERVSRLVENEAFQEEVKGMPVAESESESEGEE